MQRSLVLNGFMGCGKTTVARALSSAAGAPWLDLDAEIERRAGKPIREIFAKDGEGAFRLMEREALEWALALEPSHVIAVGAGALLRREARLRVMERAVLVSLRVDIDEVMRRLAGGALERPLAAGRSHDELAALLELREPAYAEAHEVIDATGLGLEAIVDAVHAVWQRQPVGVACGDQSYSVEVGVGNAVQRIASQVEGRSRVLLLTDTTVDALHAGALKSALSTGPELSLFCMTPGEEHKSPATLEAIWDFALREGFDRQSIVVGFGGGVVTDVAGFAASTWMRGIPWVSLPTTLLGMVDASVGGKTAVDLAEAKNCVGAFWQPARVLCDVSYLRTESPRRFRSGLAEVVKTGLLGDRELFELLENETESVRADNPSLIRTIVERCVATKARIVSRDVRESGLRAALNLGHTIGHALESVGGFGELTHGEAVSLGLVAATRLGVRLGFTDSTLAERTERLLARLGLPTDLSRQPLEAASKLLGHDKKRGGGSVRFVFCPEPGRVEFKKLALTELQQLTCTLG